jgi:SAM-dependent methyltransferase
VTEAAPGVPSAQRGAAAKGSGNSGGGAGSVEVPRCQLCGGEHGQLQFAEGPHRVLRCPTCGLVWVTPRLAGGDLEAVYGEGYWQSASPKTRGYADYRKDEQLYLKTYRRRLEFVRAVVPAMREGRIAVLDVGCAAGYFLRVMQELGHDVRGVELSPAIALSARLPLGAVRVFFGTPVGVPADLPGFARGSFDLVTLWDVVEHVPDPQSLLRSARAMLKPDGVLLLETQNVESGFARLLGRRWQHFKHDEHLYHFAPATITRLLAQCGFEVVRNTPRYGGKYVSFGFIAERAARLGARARALLEPLRWCAGMNLYLNFGDEMVVAARPA